MAPSFVQSISATSTSSPVSLTLGSSTTAGNCLIVCFTSAATSGTNPTISGVTLGGAAGNFAQTGTVGVPSTDILTTQQWADPGCAGGQTAVSVSWTGSAGSVCVTVMEFSGLVTASVADQTAGQAVSSGTAGTFTSTATPTTTQASEVAIGAVGGDDGSGIGTITGPSSPWVNLTQTNSASTHVGLLAGYDILSSTGTPSYAGSFAASTKSYAALIVTYKAAASTAPAAPQPVAGRGRRPAPRPGRGTVVRGKFTAPAAPVFQPPFPATANRARRPFWQRQGHGAVQRGAPVTPAIPQPPYPGTANRARRPFWQRPGSGKVQPGAPWTFNPNPVVSGSWTGSYAVASGFVVPFPAAKPVQIQVTNTLGDWMFALVSWRPSTTGADVSIVVADDAHNWWEPVGAPVTDSGKAGAVRTAVWAAPAARVANSVTGATIVQVAPTGPVLALAALIVDISGILPWYQVAAITGGFANAGTSLALSAGAPPAKSVLFTAFGSDNNSDVITGPSAPWTSLTTVTATNGVDHTADVKLTPAYQVTSAGSSASASSSGTLDLAGTIAGVVINVAQPPQPSPHWPIMITEAAIGAGVQVPPSELTWTDISARALQLNVKQGKQYSQSSLSAGQGTIVLDNPDGALIPPGTGPYAGIDSGTPLRRRVIWPSSQTPHYVAFNGFFRRWPWQMDAGMYRGKTQAEVTDVWGYASGPLNSMGIEEHQIDSPYALWPATDPAGSTSASNLAAGNSLPLTQVTSKYGTGGATAVFGAAISAAPLVGANSAQVTTSGTGGGTAGAWSQSLAGNSLAYNGYGYALACNDPNYPPISGGVTVETWADCTLNAEIAGINGGTVFLATSGASPAFVCGQNNFPNGMPVVLSVAGGFTFPSPYTAGTTYYVTNAAGNGGGFDLAATQGGAAIPCTGSGDGFITAVLAWNPVVMSLRDGKGTVCGLSIRATDGALLLLQRNGTSVTSTVISTGGQDYRVSFPYHFSLAITQATWRVLVSGGGTLTASGSFSPPLPASFREASFGGIQDATAQGFAMPGTIAFPAVIPGISAQIRVISRYEALQFGLSGEVAWDRAERILEYAGLAGRRWLGQANTLYEGDGIASGRDIGGQPAASSAGNIAASTLPAQLYVAPTGDIFYLSKFFAYNQPVRWVLGDNTAGGEIPFLPGSVATDYDPTRVSSPVQVTSLDTQYVTVPSGATASTTMAAVTAAAGKQYGGQPYQSTSYLFSDASSQYAAGSSSVDLANWVANIYRRPANRIQAVTVDAARYPLAWPFWGGASVGDMVTVNVRPPTGAYVISLTARITQTDRASQFSQDGTTGTITATLDFAPEYNALTADDPVRGRLDGSNCLGW